MTTFINSFTFLFKSEKKVKAILWALLFSLPLYIFNSIYIYLVHQSTNIRIADLNQFKIDNFNTERVSNYEVESVELFLLAYIFLLLGNLAYYIGAGWFVYETSQASIQNRDLNTPDELTFGTSFMRLAKMLCVHVIYFLLGVLAIVPFVCVIILFAFVAPILLCLLCVAIIPIIILYAYVVYGIYTQGVLRMVETNTFARAFDFGKIITNASNNLGLLFRFFLFDIVIGIFLVIITGIFGLFSTNVIYTNDSNISEIIAYELIFGILIMMPMNILVYYFARPYYFGKIYTRFKE